MNEAPAFAIVAAFAEAGRAMIISAAEQLSACMSGVAGSRWPVRLRFIGRDDGAIPSGAVFLSSLIDDVSSGDGLEQVEAKWRVRIARYRQAGHDRILLCSLFRHVAPGNGQADTVERIRRLNQLLILLSRDTGVEIADVDRLLALCGARLMGSDYRCTSQASARLAGQAITAAILDGELEGDLDGTIQQSAIAAHGGVRDIGRLLARHVEERATR